LSSELQGIDTSIVSVLYIYIYIYIAYASLETVGTATIEVVTRLGLGSLLWAQIVYMSTVVHMIRIIVREQCPFAAYVTCLMTPCALYCP